MAEGVPATEPEGEGVVVGVLLGVDGPLAPDDEDLEGVIVGDAVLLEVAVGEGEAEGGASAYSVVLSANITVLPASIGELVMGCAVGVV